MATRTYRKCPNPKCGKKGVYKSNGYPYWGNGTECCRYCNLTVAPDQTDEQGIAQLKAAWQDFAARQKGEI